MSGNKPKVLVVEDDKDTRTVVGLYLNTLGFATGMAGNGQEAFGAIESFFPDVILLDLVMPVMDGFEFMRRYSGPVPIVIVSAWGDMQELPKVPYATFAKPIDIGEIAPTLRAAAGGWRH